MKGVLGHSVTVSPTLTKDGITAESYGPILPLISAHTFLPPAWCQTEGS